MGSGATKGGPPSGDYVVHRSSGCPSRPSNLPPLPDIHRGFTKDAGSSNLPPLPGNRGSTMRSMQSPSNFKDASMGLPGEPRHFQRCSTGFVDFPKMLALPDIQSSEAHLGCKRERRSYAPESKDEKVFPISVISALAGETLTTISMSEHFFVRDLKEEIAESIGTQPSQQTLVMDSEVLRDNDQIQSVQSLNTPVCVQLFISEIQRPWPPPPALATCAHLQDRGYLPPSGGSGAALGSAFSTSGKFLEVS